MQDQKAFFSGTSDYIASEELQNSVNVAVAPGRPLLIKGEPGTQFYQRFERRHGAVLLSPKRSKVLWGILSRVVSPYHKRRQRTVPVG